jgi:tetratricopeptide (TPR) repeat protein
MGSSVQRWLGIHAQVVLDDDEAAEALLKRALALSRRANDPLNESYAERHLGYVEQSAGRLDAALARFNRSLVLRRSLDFPAGIAAALLALAELHLARGDLETVDTLLSEATDVAIACGATSVVGWTAATRAELVKVMAMDQADS